MLGLGFPGGVKIANLAEKFRTDHDREDFDRLKNLFPRPYLERDSLDFSFSGLKSAVKRSIDEHPERDEKFLRETAFAFEEAVIDVLVKKIFLAAEHMGTRSLVLAGGVSANTVLRARIQDRAELEGYSFVAPVKNVYSGDNAAMIGIRAYYEIVSQK